MASIFSSLSPETVAAAEAVSTTRDADIILFNAAITRRNQVRFFKLLEARRRKPKAFLILFTEGGDADAAYKISRLLQQWYEQFTCFLPGYCKSAGTLVLMGANEIVINDDGEMGPVDIQMAKKDELAEYQSGLTVLTALTALHDKAYLAWEKFFLSLEERFEGSITLKTAAHISSELTTGLFSPIYSQIDPLQLGEAVRAMSIGTEYGKRLNMVGKNLRPNALEELVANYPDHGFVIDRVEAQKLFYRVLQATEQEQKLFKALTTFCDLSVGRKSPQIDYISKELIVPTGDNNDGTSTQAEQSTPGLGTEAAPTYAGGIIPPNGH
jgi:Serine dehydrogenase proteinase